MNFIIEHWEGLASIFLAIVSIAIAIYSARSTSKDASKQIESVKELGQIQAEASLLAIETELQKVSAELDFVNKEYFETRKQRMDEEYEEMRRSYSGINFPPQPKFSGMTKKREEDLEKRMNYLMDLRKRLMELRERMAKCGKEVRA